MNRIYSPDKLPWISQSKSQEEYPISQGLYEVEILCFNPSAINTLKKSHS